MERSECQRHFPFGPESTDPSTYRFYYTARCTHIGDRFVVETKSVRSSFITVDYVQERRGDQEMLVEANDMTGDDAQLWADDVYAAMVSKMQQDYPPEADWAFRLGVALDGLASHGA